MAVGSKGPEVQAGIVVLVGLIILVGGLYYVSGGKEQFESKKKYTIHFENGGGLGSGDSVYFAGQKVGKVDAVGTVMLTRDGVRRRFVAVTIEIGAIHEIPVDSSFKVYKTITSTVTMEIDSGIAKEVATSETILFGRRMATFEETIDNAAGLLGDVRGAVQEIRVVIETAQKKVEALDIEGIQRQIDEILVSVKTSADGVEGIIKDAAGPVDRTLAKAEGAAANLEELTASLKKDWAELETMLRTILVDVEDASQNLKGIVSENRPGIKSIVQHLDDASRRIAPTVAKIEAVAKGADEMLIELRPELLKTMKGAAKAFENFEALTEDLKTAPWKLINKPSDEESDQVHLYNAARLYVEAAARISENIEDLDTLRRLGILDDPERKELAQKVIATLDQSLKDFQNRQQKLVDLMKVGSGKN